MPGSKRLLLALLILAFPSPGWSQDLSTELPLGSRLRVNTRGQETLGRLRVLWTDSLEMAPEGGLAPMTVRFSNIDRLEVSMEPPGRSRQEAVMGGLIGGVLGGLPSPSSVENHRTLDRPWLSHSAHSSGGSPESCSAGPLGTMPVRTPCGCSP